MIEALGLEVAAIRKQGGSKQISLHGGERVAAADGQTLYAFSWDEELVLRDESPVRIITAEAQAEGAIVSLREGALIVALEQDLGPRIPQARLIVDESFLIDRLKTRLEEVSAGTARFNRAMAERVLGRSPARTADAEPPPDVFLGGNPPNDEQKAAIRRSLGSETTFVWGPPGTGKTSTLARIVDGHYRAGRSVLLVSNTNIAVDTALEKIAGRLETEAAFQDGAVLRLGPIVKDALRGRFGEQVDIERVVARRSQSLLEEKERVDQDLRVRKSEVKSLETAIKELTELDALRRQLDHETRGLAADRVKHRQMVGKLEEQQRKFEQLRADLERAQRMGTVRRLFSGLSPERLTRDIMAAERERGATETALQALNELVASKETTVGDLTSQIQAAQDSLSAFPSLPESQARHEQLRSVVEALEHRLRALQQELAAVRDQVLKGCRVLATTIYRAYLNGRLPRDFDVVVIDEASMLMTPMSFYAAGLAQRSVTIAGDFRQLPPIVRSDEPLAREWLHADVFTKAGIPAKIDAGETPKYLTALFLQYRMAETICAPVNTIFYQNKLRTDSSVRRRKSNFPLARSPLLFVNTAPFHPWTAFRLRTFSRYNLLHAMLIRNIAMALHRNGYLQVGAGGSEAFGAVAPYAEQTRLLRAIIGEKLGTSGTTYASTVHSFQGNEKKTIVVDITDSIGAWLGRFMKATRIDEDGARLLNVALSRAQDHLILIANFDFLREKAPENSIIDKVLTHFERHGEPLQVKDLLPLGDADWIDGLHGLRVGEFHLPQGAAGVFTEGTFYPGFRQDLLRARSSIVIFSPFLTEHGAARWVDHLRAGLARGVRVRLVTRPPGRQGGVLEEGLQECIEKLRALEITVDLRATMHEKVALIDEEILWHGSLNILSHRDTSESMLRIPSRAACVELMRCIMAQPAAEPEMGTIAQRENRDCDRCGATTVLHIGRYGVYFTCDTCGAKFDSRRATAAPNRHRRAGANERRPPTDGEQEHQRHGISRQQCPRPGCNGFLVERQSRYGPFLGCTNYPECRQTAKVG